MDDRRFDSLAKALAAGKSRRSVLKGLLGLGGAAAVGSLGMEHDAEAARRPAPTPKPVGCPGSQVWNGSACACEAGITCGPECCPEGVATCCDGACCFGECIAEEVCCPSEQWCADTGECCPVGTVCCGTRGCVAPEDATCCCNDLQRCWDGLCFYKCEISGCQECDAWWNCISMLDTGNYCYAQQLDIDCEIAPCPEGFVCYFGTCINPC